MNRSAYAVWMGLLWIVSLGMAYLVGWYKGAKSAATVAVHTASSSISYILIAMGVVAIVSAFLALKARGFFSRRSAPMNT